MTSRTPHPPGYRPNYIHVIITVAGFLERIPPLALTPTWLALSAIGCWPWETLRLPAAALLFGLILTDGISLALLPRTGRSFGPVTPPLLALALARTALHVGLGLAWPTLPGLLLTAALQLAILTASIYATWIEPFRLTVTEMTLQSSKLAGHPPLRLLHISDIHVEGITPRERSLLRQIEALAPDVILLTGDYLNLSSVHDPQAQAQAHDLLGQICASAPGPVYAIIGSPPVDRPEIVPRIFSDLPITWLLDDIQTLHLNDHVLRIVGLRCTADRGRDGPRLRRLLDGSSEGQPAFTLLLYHSPDLMPEAVELGVDLYLCGHTHGGQIRLPLFGALFTSSDFWKRYEMGRYEEGGTTLYVSRGLGVEGLGAPRARFLASPEIILWTLS